jgi:hypothetical protein
MGPNMAQPFPRQFLFKKTFFIFPWQRVMFIVEKPLLKDGGTCLTDLAKHQKGYKLDISRVAWKFSYFTHTSMQ